MSRRPPLADGAFGPRAGLMPALMRKTVLRLGVQAAVALLPKLGEAMGQPLTPEAARCRSA